MDVFEIVALCLIGLVLLLAVAVVVNNALWRPAVESKPEPVEAPTVPIRRAPVAGRRP